jgi:hypothetical protein
MKKPILGRYEPCTALVQGELTDNDEVIIDVSIRTVEDLYNNFDRTAPYMKKDLDQEFVDYIIDCVREIGGKDFVIRITLSKPQASGPTSRGMPDELIKERVRRSIDTFFHYLQEIERRELDVMFRRSFKLLGIGLALLALAIAAKRHFSSGEGVLAEVFAQGLTIAAWISLWEAIANLFVEWHPHTKNIRLYERVTKAPVTFRHLPTDQNAAESQAIPKS